MYINNIHLIAINLMRIKIFSSFCSTDHAKKSSERLLTPYLNIQYGPNFNVGSTNTSHVYIVGENDEDYSHVIIWNTAMPNIPERIPKRNIIGVAFEPPPYLNITPAFIEYAMTNIHAYYIGDSDGLPSPFIEGNAYLPYMTPPVTVPYKGSTISMVLSHKRDLPGHKYRHKLASYILHHNLPIDIFGNGTVKRKYQTFNSERIKGPFDNQRDPYEEYLFTIAIENVSSNHYFSEKIINPMLDGCVPLYLGCRNIERYFPGKLVLLNGDIVHDMNVLLKVLQNPIKYSKNINPLEIQKKVCYLNNLDTLFQINDKSPPKIVAFPDNVVTRANSLYLSSSDSENESVSSNSDSIFHHVDSDPNLTNLV